MHFRIPASPRATFPLPPLRCALAIPLQQTKHQQTTKLTSNAHHQSTCYNWQPIRPATLAMATCSIVAFSEWLVEEFVDTSAMPAMLVVSSSKTAGDTSPGNAVRACDPTPTNNTPTNNHTDKQCPSSRRMLQLAAHSPSHSCGGYLSHPQALCSFSMQIDRRAAKFTAATAKPRTLCLATKFARASLSKAALIQCISTWSITWSLPCAVLTPNHSWEHHQQHGMRLFLLYDPSGPTSRPWPRVALASNHTRWGHQEDIHFYHGDITRPPLPPWQCHRTSVFAMGTSQTSVFAMGMSQTSVFAMGTSQRA